MYGFSQLPVSFWADEHLSLIKRYFKGQHSDWSKASLKSVRDSVRAELLEKQLLLCAYCRREMSPEIGRNEIDHVLPKATAGFERFTYEKANLVVACKSCNWHKREHNSLVSSFSVGVSYPLAVDDYVWVHPYVHKYEDHIRIEDGVAFVAIGNDAAKKRALAVIGVCKLTRIAVVERRVRLARLRRGSTVCDVVFFAVAVNPTATNAEVARLIKRHNDSFSKYSHDQLSDVVRQFRDTTQGMEARLSSLLNLK